MSNPSKPPQEHGEQELFRLAIGDTRPLRTDRVEPFHRRPKPWPTQTQRDQQQVLRDMLSDTYEPAELETGEELIHLRAGVQQRVLRDLRRGRIAVQGELDLHGMTVAEAKQALLAYLADCRVRRLRCIRVVHGKGLGSFNREPVLKHKVNLWLRQRQEVLAFTSARPVDGGTGAIYLLLSSKR